MDNINMEKVEQLHKVLLDFRERATFNSHFTSLLKKHYPAVDKLCFLSNGATKSCLVMKHKNFVLKFNLTCDADSDNGSPVFREVSLYKKACEKGLSMFFPETRLLINDDDIVIIAQQKVDYQWRDIYETKSMQSYVNRVAKTPNVALCRKINLQMIKQVTNSRYVNEQWIAMSISLYGKRKVKELTQFIAENNIGDLHEANIGILKKKPIILDFAGYDDTLSF